MADSNTISILIQAKDQASGTLGSMVGNFQSGMKTISVATAGVGVALTAFAKSSTDYLTDLVKSSKSLATQTGMTVEQSSDLLAVMSRLGVSSDQASVAFKTFSKQISESADNTAANKIAIEQLQNKIDSTKESITATTAEIAKNGDASGVLKTKLDGLNLTLQQYQQQISTSSNTLDALGVSTTNADGTTRDFNDVLLDVADKFKDMPNGAQKTADALALFGKSGLTMINVLNQGSQGILDLEKQAENLGLTLTAQNIGAISSYIQSQKDLTASTNSIKIAVGSLTAPIMTEFNTKLNDTIQSLVGMHSPMRNVTADVLAFGGPVASAVSATTAFLGNLGSTGPVLKGVGLLMVNPIFFLFAVAVGGIADAVLKLHDRLGSWSAVMTDVQDKIMKVWDAITNYLWPKIEALWNTIDQQLVPAMLRLWQNVIMPMVPILGVVLVGAFGLVIDVINGVMNVLAPLINFMASNPAIIYGLVGAFVALRAAMIIADVVAAFQAGMAAVDTAILIVRTNGIGALSTDLLAMAGPAGPFALVAAAGVGAFAAIYSAGQKTLSVLDSVNKSQADDYASESSAIQQIEQDADSGKITHAKAASLISQLGPSGKATGGPVSSGTPYIVGEQGQELFIPNQPGTIVPAKQTAAMLNGQGSTVNNLNGTFNFANADASNAFWDRLDKTTRLAKMGMA